MSTLMFFILIILSALGAGAIAGIIVILFMNWRIKKNLDKQHDFKNGKEVKDDGNNATNSRESNGGTQSESVLPGTAAGDIPMAEGTEAGGSIQDAASGESAAVEKAIRVSL